MKYLKGVLVVIGIMLFFNWGIGQTAQDFIRFNQRKTRVVPANV